MPESGKRKLSAKQILADIRSGMDASVLKHKHGLSDKSFGYVLRQLSTAGLLTEDEMRRLQPGSGPSKLSHQAPVLPPQWRCPACNASQPAEVRECPVCGVVVAKFVAGQEERHLVSRFSPSYTRDADWGGGTSWTSVIVSIVIFALIGGAVLVWSSHRAKEKTNLAALDLRTPSSQKVENEAGQYQEDSNDLESTDIDSSEVKIEDGPGRIEAPPPIVALPKEVPARQAEPSRETPLPPSETPKYVTGVLRQFASGDFKKEVVEASKTYPVLFQFYSNT